MGVRSVDAAGNGVAAPVDVQREQQLLDNVRVPPAEIPQKPIDQLAEQRSTTTSNQWTAQEDVQRGRGSLWQNGDLGKWSGFEKGKNRDETGLSRAAITIDQDQQTGGRRKTLTVQDALAQQQAATRNLLQTDGGPQDTPAWRNLGLAHRQAHLQEERARNEIDPFLGNAPKRTAGRYRRRVLLEE